MDLPLALNLTELTFSLKRRRSAIDGGAGYLTSRVTAARQQIAALDAEVSRPTQQIPHDGNPAVGPAKIELWKTVAEADQVGFSTWRVTQLCRVGNVAAKRAGRCWLVDVESAHEYLRDKGRRKKHDSGG